MPNPDLKITATADATGLQTGLNAAVTTSRTQLAELQGQYKQASANIRKSVEDIIGAEKTAAIAMEAGNTELAAFAEQSAEAQRRAMDSVIAKHYQLETSIKSIKGSLSGHATTVQQAAVATEALAGAHGHAVPQVAAASAAIREFEGNLPIRAVERFAVNVLGLGPILQAAFPILGGIAVIGMLVEAGKKVRELYNDFVDLKSAQEEVEKVAKQLAQTYEEAYQRITKYQVEALRNQGKLVEAARLEIGAAASVPIKLPELDKEKLKGLSDEQKKGLATYFGTEVIPADLPRAISDVKDRVHALNLDLEDWARGAVRVGAGTQRQTEVQKQAYDGLLATLEILKQAEDSRVATSGEKIAKAAAEEQRKREEIARKAEEAARKRAQQLREADEGALADIKADHQVTIQETIDFWQKRLAVEQSSAERVREIRRTLGNLYQERGREQDIERNKSVDQGAREADVTGGGGAKLEFLQGALEKYREFPKTVEHILAEIPSAQKEATRQANEDLKRAVNEQYDTWTTGARRSTTEIVAFWQGVQRIYSQYPSVVEEATRRVTAATEKQREEQRKLLNLQEQGRENDTLSGFDARRAGIERAEQLSLDDSIAAQVRYLEQLRAIDQQIINEKLRAARAIAANDANDPVKHQEDLNKIVQIQAAGEAKIYADNTAILLKQRANYRAFFQEVQRGFAGMIANMATGQRSWVQGLQQIENQAIGNFATLVSRRVTLWLEGTAAIQAIERGWHSLMLALHLATAEAETAIDTSAAATTATEKQAIQAAQGPLQVESAAAIGAANAWAATSLIPIVGPELAPGVAAATFAGIMTLAPLAAFETGGIVPKTGIVMAHEKEGILPARLTQMLMNVANTGGGGSSTENNLNVGGIHMNGGGKGAGQDVIGALRSMARRNNMRFA